MKTKFYVLTLIFAFLSVLFFVTFHITGGDVIFTLFITSLTFFYHLYARILVGALVNKRKRPFNPKNSWFAQKDFEKSLYKALNVKRWKSKAPTFEPESFSFEHNTPDEVIQNMCGAELIHEINVPISFLSIFLCRLCDEPSKNIAVFLITAVIAASVDLIFVIIQRYNRPRLMKLLRHKRFNDEQNSVV